MDVKVMLFLLLACESLPEGNTREYPPFHGVNGPKGTTREPQPFHCTRSSKGSTSNHETLEPLVIQQSNALSKTEKSTADLSEIDPLTATPTTDNQKHDVAFTEQLNTAQQTKVTTEGLSSSSPTEGGLTSDQQPTKQLTSTPPTSVTGRYHTTDQQTTKQLNTTSPSPLTDRDLTFNEQTTKQLNTTSPLPLTERNLTSEQQTTQRPTPPTSPPCAPYMVLRPECPCPRTCQNPTSCNCAEPQTCVCPDGFLMNNTECVPEEHCECYYEEGGIVIPNGRTYVNNNCSERCLCNHNQLQCDSTDTSICGPHVGCEVRDGIPRCFCHGGYIGDSVTCEPYTDCYDAYQDGHRQSGVFVIFPDGWTGSPFQVSCDMTTGGGGWTVLQQRSEPLTFGEKTWEEYKDGFGFPYGNYWLGNDKIYSLTHQQNYKLRVDLVLSNGSTIYQEYSFFEIVDETDNYRLVNLGHSSGTAGDGMTGSLGRQFSTRDRDNDECDDIHCSERHGFGGWWYSNKWCDKCCGSKEQTCFYHQSSKCTKRCAKANLNGAYNHHNNFGIFWNDFNHIESTEMRIRPNMN